ncbi:DUF1835 domain-containing protein [Loktanella sp. IMCC34160]|uniref:DUF1835 domain-containing protein n=1 Tax=Loktanella sp. IMCC34160 TaxID=2510646 RepID=UPI00101BBF5F|nr:DUF1835 domain-containing protein [Loktanella sp. IMCC34160]RYG89646.1 DUF1835 domain-containing protein [Loktanella sp. IMCC34160]
MKNVILTQSLSAGGTIRQLFRKIRPDWQTRVIASYDDYSHGPLAYRGTGHDFVAKRREFWRSFDPYDTDIIHAFDLKDEYDLMVNEVISSQNAEIWISDSVQDFFYATVVLHLMTAEEINTSGISVRYFGGKQVKWGLGVLRVEELEDLYCSNTAESFDPEYFKDAWKAISAGSGEAISGLIEVNAPSTPMAKALSAYLLRFPRFNGGLGSIERSLLGAGTEEMKNAAYTVGNAMAKGEPPNDRIGDHVLFKRLVELCDETSAPWFRLEGDRRRMRSCSVQITESGKAARERYSVQGL